MGRIVLTKRGYGMKIEDAIIKLKYFLKRLESAIPTKDTEIITIAISALEKQIPKKPIEYDGVPHFLCPNCNKDVFAYDHHCECGQALKWEE